MAYFEPQTKSIESVYEKFGTALRNIKVRIDRYRLYSETVTELSSLSARELADLGLSRSMIKNVAYSAVYLGRFERKDMV